MMQDWPAQDDYEIRDAVLWDIVPCEQLVRETWGDKSADRLRSQFAECMRGGEYAPKFWIATVGLDKFVGFCSARKSMLMAGFWEFIWVAVHPEHHGKGVGTKLTEHRLEHARWQNATAVLLVTQKPKYFNRFGFKVSEHHGNDWVQMTAQLKMADME